MEGYKKWLEELRAYAEQRELGWLILEGGDYEVYFKYGMPQQEAFEEELDAAMRGG